MFCLYKKALKAVVNLEENIYAMVFLKQCVRKRCSTKRSIMKPLQVALICFKCKNRSEFVWISILCLITMAFFALSLSRRDLRILNSLRTNEYVISHNPRSFNSTYYPTLVFTCIGEEALTKFQSYIWHSLRQARLINPNIPIVVILSRKGYDKSLRHKFLTLKVTIIYHDTLVESIALLQEFRKVFFLKGAMIPDGNKLFVQFAVERLLSVYAYMKYTGTSNVFHVENDNMIYVDLLQLSKRMNACGVKFSIPRAAIDQAVTSFIYARTAEAIEHFAQWCVHVFRMGPDRAVRYLNTQWINDMTLGAQYLRLYASSGEKGVYELPTRFHTKFENCCLCYLSSDYKGPIIFDACVLGQYFGGTFARPNVPHWEENRLIDPRGNVLEWRMSLQDKLKRPFIRGIRIVNIHVHSKQLEKFSSSTT